MIGFILQARSTSTRMPGKVLLPFYKDASILDILIGNLQKFFPQIPIVLATTRNQSDDEIASLKNKFNIKVYRGDEHNVVKRTVEAANEFGIETVIRVCSDNPFLNMGLVQTLIEVFEKNPSSYLSFKSEEGIPVIRTHLGLFVEITTTKDLESVLNRTEDSFYLEHVTNFIYGNPQDYKVELIHLPNILKKRNDLRFTIDNPNDFETGKYIYSELPDHGQDLENLVNFVDENNIHEKMKKEIIKYEK